MSDSLEEVSKLVGASLKLHYSESVATKACKQFLDCNENYRVYTIGCLLLTLTASVQPQYTLLSDRKRTFQTYPQWSSDPDKAADLAEAGLYQQDNSRLTCFHCSAKVPCHASGLASPAGALDCHRTASPNCYYVRFVDFVTSRGDLQDPRLGDTVTRDVNRYVKALRKLEVDLDCHGLEIAATYGYDMRSVAFYMTRQFMRNSGRVPDRAGDIIELVHTNESLFAEKIPQTVDVKALLRCLKQLADVRGDSSNRSIVIGRYNQQSGTWESTPQTLTSEQFRALQDMMRQRSLP